MHGATSRKKLAPIVSGARRFDRFASYSLNWRIVPSRSSWMAPNGNASRSRLVRRSATPITCSGVDAAGIGELVRAFNMSAVANGALRVVHATAPAREMLERAQLFERLSGARTIEQRLA